MFWSNHTEIHHSCLWSGLSPGNLPWVNIGTAQRWMSGESLSQWVMSCHGPNTYWQEFFSRLDVTCVQLFSFSSSEWRSSRTHLVLTLEPGRFFFFLLSQSDCHRMNGAPTPNFFFYFICGSVSCWVPVASLWWEWGAAAWHCTFRLFSIYEEH